MSGLAFRNLSEAEKTQAQKSSNPNKAALLEEFMPELSETLWCASWLIGCGYHFWKETINPDDLIEADDRAYLIELSQACDGWWYYKEGVDGRQFATLNEWKDIFEKGEGAE